jgi:lysophospholipase L1-like esterase
MLRNLIHLVTLFCALIAGAAHAEQPWTLSNNTRYLALGDSLAAGYGAMPATNGYTYLLYREGVFDRTSNTLFANAAVPGATSQDVINYQLPQVPRFPPHVVTVSVGGNDLLGILADILGGGTPPTPEALIQYFTQQLGTVLVGLCTQAPGARIYIGNLYTIQNFPVSTADLVGLFNAVLHGVVGNVNAICGNRIRIADVFGAFGGFDGQQEGLLLINRNGAGAFEVHPTNAGYRAMAAAYKAVLEQP